jgi:peptide/nickel transport system ATP-binding protein
MTATQRAEQATVDDVEPLLSVQNLVVEFPAAKGTKVHAVSDVSFAVAPGETLGLVGESGCGKSTVAKAVTQHGPITSGQVTYGGRDLSVLGRAERRAVRTEIQMIFQDPIASLNPRRPIEGQIREGLRVWKRGSAGEQRAQVQQIMELCGLAYDPAAKRRRHHFSGGQCQRISIARALIMDPRFIVCDEPVSSLDVSVQAQILNLLVDMRDRFGLTMLFISHDLAVVRYISDRVAVMYLGRICEVAPVEELYLSPRHHYTTMLLTAIPVPDPRANASDTVPVGDIPSPIAPPSGCRFRTRCPRAEERCAVEVPELRTVGPRHAVACHFPVEAPSRGVTC